jgi:poly-beta-1,6-N-acetyl-D-glucosamine N-deacetylase
LRVITYHVVRDQLQFEKQLKYLKGSGATFLTLGEFLDKLTGKKQFKSTDTLITFDDGDYTVYERGMPLLKKHDIPAVLFVITALINTDKPFWWDEIMYYTQDYNKVRWAKTISNQERLKYLTELREETAKPPCKQKQLTIDELKEMEKNGIAIGNHTMSHPMLDKLSDDELESELISSNVFLRENGFEYHNVLAYPNGNISEMVVEKLRQKGYRAGFLFNHRLTNADENPYKISRLSMNDYTPLWKYKMILSGLHSTLLQVKRKALG